jgi:serine/threonine-protein kinase
MRDERPASADSPLESGVVVAGYELIAPLGSGATGDVWIARQPTSVGIARFIALKFARVGFEERAARERAYANEAAIGLALAHPNVGGVYELGVDGGLVFLVMEWLDGASLDRVLAAAPGTPLDGRVAARAVADACAGLHAAHELTTEHGTQRHIVHRDISSSNLFVTRSGQVKVIDFGVAQRDADADAGAQREGIHGTVAYMAPEQARGQHVDRRADVFAVGAVLYHATVGRPPFDAPTKLEAIRRRLQERAVPPSRNVLDYPRGLERIVLRALEPEPGHRYATTLEFQRDLEAWLVHEGVIRGDALLTTALEERLGEQLRRRTELVRDVSLRLDGRTRASRRPRASTRSGHELAGGARGSSRPPGSRPPPRSERPPTTSLAEAAFTEGPAGPGRWFYWVIGGVASALLASLAAVGLATSLKRQATEARAQPSESEPGAAPSGTIDASAR